MAGATPGAASGPSVSEDEATTQLEALMRAWGDSSFYEPIVQAVFDNSPVITPLSAKQVVKAAIKRLPVLDESDARPTGYEARSRGRIWPTLQAFWAEGEHESVISALQMMIQIEVVYQKYLVNGSDAVAEKITEILSSVDDYGALRFSPMMEGGVAKHVELLATRRWGKSQGGRGGMSVDADGVQRFEFKTSGKSTMTEFPADVKLKEDGSNSDDYFKYQFRLYKSLRANASRTKCAGSLNESTLQAAAKSSQHIRDSWVNFGLSKTDISSSLSNLTFVISGVFEMHSREEIKNLIEINGGKISSSISSKTDYLVAGNNLGPAKYAKANNLGVPIINEVSLIDLIS